jgi:soluble P-type ATPase
MIAIDAPGWGTRRIEHLVMDFNGTLACDGMLLPGVDERLMRLSMKVRLHLVTADSFGTVSDESRRFELALKIIKKGAEDAQKAELVQRLGPLQVAVIGNGRNDVGMLREAGLSIAVLGPEGASAEALAAATLVCPDILSALDLLLHPKRLAATLRR